MQNASVSIIPCHELHFPPAHARGPSDGFSCLTLERIQLFEELNQCLNQPFQQPEKCNLQGNQMPDSANQANCKRNLSD